MRLPTFVLIASGLTLAGGCAHRSISQAGSATREFAVSFPSVKLAPQEYIQSVEVVVHCGRILSIPNLRDDWDLEVLWDNPSLLTLSSHARHFSAGLATTEKLTDLITVQDAGAGCFSVTATLVTDQAGPSDGAERKYEFSQAQLILKPIKGSSPES